MVVEVGLVGLTRSRFIDLDLVFKNLLMGIGGGRLVN